jgi:hypothetical protein
MTKQNAFHRALCESIYCDVELLTLFRRLYPALLGKPSIAPYRLHYPSTNPSTGSVSGLLRSCHAVTGVLDNRRHIAT